MNPMFDDDFFSGFGMTPFGMGRLRGNSGSERQPAQRSGAFGHPFFDQRAQDQQLREQQQMEEQRQAEEEDRRRRMLQQRRQQQQRVDPFAQMFGASPQQQQPQQRRSPPPRIAIPPSLAQNPQFQRLSPRQQQEFLRQVLARQEQQDQQEAEQQRMQQQQMQQQQQRRSPPPRMAIPASVAQNPQFQRLSPRQQQEFVRQLAAKQEQQEQEQLRQLQLQQEQQQRAEQAEAQRREQVLADALQQQQQMEAARKAQQQQQQQEHQEQHRMVCDETQTSDDEEAEPAPHRTIDEGTETEGGNIKEGVATETDTEAAPVEPASPAFMDCNDAGMANAEEDAGPVADKDFADCAETEQEAAVMQKEIEEASHASTVSSDEDMGLDEGDDAAPSGEAQAGEAAEAAAEAEPEEEEATVSPMKSLEEIEAIKKEADEVAARWAPEAFVSRNPKTNDAVKKARAFYSEGLLQCVIKLDGVDSLGDASVRQARKSAVNAIERKVEELKEWGQKHDVLA